MEARPDVRSESYSLCIDCFQELTAVGAIPVFFVECHGVMIVRSTFSTWILFLRNKPRKILQPLRKIVCIFIALYKAIFRARELRHQYCSLEFVHSVFWTNRFIAAFAGGTAIVYRKALLHQGLVVSYHCSSLTACNCFTCLETETAQVSDQANGLSLVSCKGSLTGVFDHLQVVFSGNCHDAFHVCRNAHDVNGHDSLCVFVDLLFDLVRIELVRIRIQINHYRQCTTRENSRDR